MVDKKSFEQLLGEVRKLNGNGVSPEFYCQKPVVSENKKDWAQDFQHAQISRMFYDIGPEDKLQYRRDGVSDAMMKSLSAGRIDIRECIDLHAMTTTEAEIYIANTIENQRYSHQVCIQIVHGKGYHQNCADSASTRAPLKNFTARYLAQHPRVLAYVSCPANRGATGAVYVLISKATKADRLTKNGD